MLAELHRDAPLGMAPKPGCAAEWKVAQPSGGELAHASDFVAEEVPVALEYNGIAHAVMLASPADLQEFGLGFSLSEGILESAQECYELDAKNVPAGITLRMRISSRAFMALKERRRNLAGRTGCGLCGTESLEQVLRPLPQVTHVRPVAAAALRHALGSLRHRQPLNRATGGTHAAAWCMPDGMLAAVFEDVGRHNALDKLIGAMALRGMDFRDGFALITSRASVEMVQKAATLGIPAIAAISAPTGLAARAAQSCGMTLLAFARGDGFSCYAHHQHIQL